MGHPDILSGASFRANAYSGDMIEFLSSSGIEETRIAESGGKIGASISFDARDSFAMHYENGIKQELMGVVCLGSNEVALLGIIRASLDYDGPGSLFAITDIGAGNSGSAYVPGYSLSGVSNEKLQVCNGSDDAQSIVDITTGQNFMSESKIFSIPDSMVLLSLSVGRVRIFRAAGASAKISLSSWMIDPHIAEAYLSRP